MLSLLFSFNLRGQTLLILIKSLHLCKLGLQIVFASNNFLRTFISAYQSKLNKSAVQSHLL